MAVWGLDKQKLIDNISYHLSYGYNKVITPADVVIVYKQLLRDGKITEQFINGKVLVYIDDKWQLDLSVHGKAFRDMQKTQRNNKESDNG
jgi:hypothetical protein